MKVSRYEYNGEGMTRVYENEKWMIGIKNWKPANDISQLNCLERHNETDELFVLLAGGCTLIIGHEKNGEMELEKVEMEPMKVYNIPKSLWHNTITQKKTKMILMEDVSTSMKNSEIYNLSEEEIKEVKYIYKYPY